MATFLLTGCELVAIILLGESLSVERILLSISGSSILDVEMIVELTRCQLIRLALPWLLHPPTSNQLVGLLTPSMLSYGAAVLLLHRVF